MQIAIIWLPGRGQRREFDSLLWGTDVHAAWVEPDDYWRCFPEGADIIILPGSHFTVTDMQCVRGTGFDKVVIDHVAAGKQVIGICGGYQILGQKLYDPLLKQGNVPEIDGIGLLPSSTLFGPRMLKAITTARCSLLPADEQIVHGEDSRSGFTWRTSRSKKFSALSEVIERDMFDETQPPKPSRSIRKGKLWAPGSEKVDGLVRRDKLVMGTYLHHLFDNDAFRKTILSPRAER